MFSISVFISFIILSFTISRTVIKYGIKSTLTSHHILLYLHALCTSDLKSPITHFANISKNFLVILLVIYLVWISGDLDVSIVWEPHFNNSSGKFQKGELSHNASILLESSSDILDIVSLAVHITILVILSANSLVYLL